MHLFVTAAQRDQYVAAGLDPETCFYKPNSVDAWTRPRTSRRRAAFVGRISPEKGVRELAAAWDPAGPQLAVAGDGPQSAELESTAAPNVQVLGRLTHAEVGDLLSSSGVLVMPSLGPEGLPIVLLEALAAGTPVVAFRGTAISAVARDLDPAFTVPVGDYAGLVEVAKAVLAMPEDTWALLSDRARDLQLERFSDAANVQGLIGAYELALRLRSRTADEASAP